MIGSWSTARPDWEVRIAAGQSLLPDGLPINRARADKALRIFKRLRVVDIPGQPCMGDVCPAWILGFVEAIFGAYDGHAKRQLIREFFVCIAKKNLKSTLAAGIMITALVMHSRHNEEFLILAPTKDVADNSFIPAYNMVKADPTGLFKVFKPSESTREITNRLDGSILAVKSADAEVLGGQKATSVFVDELWLFGKKAAAKNILSEATGSLAARPEGFVIYATTQSDDPPAGVFREKLDYHRDVRDGKVIDPASLPLIYEYPPAMQKAEAWRDSRTWHIPNPSIGKSVDPTWIGGKLAQADREGADSLRLFAAKHFNVEIGMGLRTNRWPGATYWERQADPALAALPTMDALDALLERSEVATIGIDGGGLDDLFGLCVLGREKETRRWLAWSHAWCHVGVLDTRKSIATKLRDFEKAGDLTIVDDELGDISEIVEIIAGVKDRGLLGGVGVDPAGLGEFVDAMVAIGVTQEEKLLVGVGQGYQMMNSLKTAERKLAGDTLRHCGGGLMAWSIGNLKIEPTATAIRATKQNAGDAKIDPAMALFDAVSLMTTNPEAAAMGVSIYDRPELWGDRLNVAS